MPLHAAPTMPRFAVAVDVGKRSFALSVTDSGRRRLLGPVECAMQRRPVRELVGQVARVVDDGDGPVHVGGIGRSLSLAGAVSECTPLSSRAGSRPTGWLSSRPSAARRRDRVMPAA